ncbi:TIGR02594 family protein [Mesorhizobium sp.]|uniref:TIGR02594 family protein n=1 Tax=Mesorhizobium sp. TaxID=1871066 RepID=UPI000FE7C73B|nr:TIGR02594 family protein [Mesorhizobium sp.]RWP05103.1 MAG: TIGR02594 family protein [Mesorhizobium sp.]
MPSALDMARTVLGKTEGADRAALMDYLTTGGVNLDPATTAWCAAFVNASLKKAGMEGTGSNMARSFLEWGQAVKDPQPGDVAVYPRGKDPRFGHVGFVEAVDPKTDMVSVLGGNQSDSVKVNQYALDAALGYRRATGQPTAAPAGPVEAAGGGAGSEATGMPATAPAAPAAPTAVAAAEPKQPWNKRLGESLLKGGGSLMQGGFKPFTYDVAPTPAAARIEQGAVPTINREHAEMQRQQLAQIMARLNSGRLV